MISAYLKLDVDTSEKFTELYFTKPQELPNRIFPDEEIPINFTILNKEGKDVEYIYEISYEDLGNQIKAEQTKILVNNNDKKDIRSSISIGLPASRSAITVTLLNKDQHITQWVERAAQ